MYSLISSSPRYFTTAAILTQPFFWMLYSYSCLVISVSSLFTSLCGEKHYQFLYTFIRASGCLATSSWVYRNICNNQEYTVRSAVFIAVFNILTFWSFVHFPAIDFSALPIHIPSTKPFLLYSCTCLPIPYFGLLLTRIHSLREKSLLNHNYIRYLNSAAGILSIGVGICLYYYQEDKSSPWSVVFFVFLSQFVLSLICLLGTKTEFGFYDSCIQNALGHALASYGLSRETWIVFVVCSMLTAGRYFVEDLHISAAPPERMSPYPRITAL